MQPYQIQVTPLNQIQQNNYPQQINHQNMQAPHQANNLFFQQSPQFYNQFKSPQHQSPVEINKVNRVMYSSTIVPSQNQDFTMNKSSFGGFSKL